MDLLATKLQKASPRMEDNLAAPHLPEDVSYDQDSRGQHGGEVGPRTTWLPLSFRVLQRTLEEVRQAFSPSSIWI